MRVPSSLPLLTSASCDYFGDRSDNLPSRSLSVSPTTTTAGVIVCFSWTHGELPLSSLPLPPPFFLPFSSNEWTELASLRRFYCEMARNQPTLRVTLSVHRALRRLARNAASFLLFHKAVLNDRQFVNNLSVGLWRVITQSWMARRKYYWIFCFSHRFPSTRYVMMLN